MFAKPQRLLLIAALADPPEASSAWQEWCSARPFASTSDGGRRLFPLILRNLGPAAPEAARLAAATDETWLANSALWSHARALVDQLVDDGVPVMIIKGMALATRVYGDWALRPMSDVDVVVRHEHARIAIAAVAAHGYSADPPNDRRLEPLLKTGHALNFSSPGGGRLDLHWHALAASPCDGSDRAFWEAAEPAVLHGSRVVVLTPADELVLACAHAAHNRLVAGYVPLHILADVATIIRRCHVAWPRVSSQASALGLTSMVASVIGALRQLVPLPVPETVMRALMRTRPTLAERLERLMVGMPPHGRALTGGVARYLRLRANPSYRKLGVGTLRYLRDWWDLDSIAAVPRAFGRRFGHHVASFRNRE